MECNVFGNTITSSMLSVRDRASDALVSKKSIDSIAQKYVEKVKVQYSVAEDVWTICLIYNATGNPITLFRIQDWSGYLFDSSYPWQIENGQCGTFFHRQVSPKGGSSGAVVYRFRNVAYVNYCCYIAWSTVEKAGNCDNKVYGEVVELAEVLQYGEAKWLERVRAALLNSGPGHGSKPFCRSNCCTVISVATGLKAVVEAVITLSNL